MCMPGYLCLCYILWFFLIIWRNNLRSTIKRQCSKENFNFLYVKCSVLLLCINQIVHNTRDFLEVLILNFWIILILSIYTFGYQFNVRYCLICPHLVLMELCFFVWVFFFFWNFDFYLPHISYQAVKTKVLILKCQQMSSIKSDFHAHYISGFYFSFTLVW